MSEGSVFIKRPSSTPAEDDGAVLKALLERVRAATGPDREIDAAIHCEFVEDATLYTDERGRLIAKSRHAPFHDWLVGGSRLPAYTASIDSAVALVERVLPGLMMELVWIPGSNGEARLHGPGDPFRGKAATPALAIIAALLTALDEVGGVDAERLTTTNPLPENGGG